MKLYIALQRANLQLRLRLIITSPETFLIASHEALHSSIES